MKSITREELVEWYAEASGRFATIFWITLYVFGFHPPLCQKSVLELTENTHVKPSS